jgi:MFS family permease
MEGLSQETRASAGSLDLATKVVMLLGGALASLAMVGINSVLPAIDTALARGPEDSLLVKQLLGVVGLAMMGGAILAGFLVERVAIRTILLVSACVYVVAGMAGLYLSDLRLLLVSRLLLGLSAATIQITAFTLINTLLDGAARARWMGLHISAAMICTIAVQPIAGFIGDYSWRWPFALYALGALMLPAAILYRDGPRAFARQQHGGAPMAALDQKPFWRVFPYHYIPLAILIGSIVFLPAIYAPFLLREKGLGNPSTIGLVLTADSIAGAIVASQYGWARRYLTRYGAFAVSFAIAAVGMLFAGLSASAAGIIAGMLFYGFGVGWFVPNLMTSIGEKLAPMYQARAVGFVKAAHFSSSGIALLIMEPFARQYGTQASLLAVSAVAFALLLSVLVRSAPRAGPQLRVAA